MNARISSPLIELMGGWDTLVLPEIGGTELGATEAGSKSGTEECSEATLMEVVVKVVWSLGSSSREV